MSQPLQRNVSEKPFNSRETTSVKVVSARQVMAQCAEPLCRITIWIEPTDKNCLNKCISCQMREKLSKG